MEWSVAISILLIGITIVFAILIKFGFRLMSLPAITGYFILGTMIKFISDEFSLLTPFTYEIFYFMANVGIVALLFRIGLESKLADLLQWLPVAGKIWLGDVVLSAFLGFWSAYNLLGLELIPSLFIAAAFTPTSVGISVAVWEEMNKLNTREGKIMLDTAELDDISGILIMGILFVVAPILHENPISNEFTITIIETIVVFLLKITVFGFLCLLIAKFGQQKLSAFLNRLHSGESAMLVFVGLGMIVASISSLFGFSLAIGAFFAGLIFSGNPETIKIDASFEALHELFVPFFFVGVGLSLDVSLLSTALGPALILLAAAVAGKFFGVGIPALLTLDVSAAVLLGFSMIPRAEIALIIMQRGLALGEWAVSSSLFAYVVLISATTALLMPVILRLFMGRQGKFLTNST